MGDVLRFPRHKWHRCGSLDCFICNGGLACCVTCGGGESSLPTDCPGERMSYEVQNAVTAGDLDFKHGYWTGPLPQRQEC